MEDIDTDKRVTKNPPIFILRGISFQAQLV